MTLIATLDNPGLIRSIFEAISKLVDETYMYYNDDGIVIEDMDASHVGIISARLPRSMFTEYARDGDPGRAGVSITDIIKVLRRVKGTEPVTLSIDSYSIGIATKGKTTKTFKIKCKDLNKSDEDKQTIGKLIVTLEDRFTTSFTMTGDIIAEAIKDVTVISDILSIGSSKSENIVSISAQSDVGDVEIEFDASKTGGEEGIVEATIKDDSAGMYSVAFMEYFLSLVSISKTFTVKIGNNIPVMIRGTIGTDGSIIYILAPRVEEDEEDHDELDDVDETSEAIPDGELGEEPDGE